MDSQERKDILVDYPTVAVRPKLITFVKKVTAEAKKLNLSDLHPDGSRGHAIAVELTTALLWQLADGSSLHSDGWLNEKDEPLLYDIFDTAGSLDGTPFQAEKWNDLFKLVAELK